MIDAYQRPSPVWQLILTRLREFYREPAAVFWVYVFPILMTFTLGLAFRAEPKASYQVTVIQSDMSGKIVAQLESDGENRFVVKELVFSEARRLLRTGKTELVLVPPDFDLEAQKVSSNLSSESTEQLTYWFDPRNQNSGLARPS